MRVAKSVLGLASVSVLGRSDAEAMANKTPIPTKGDNKPAHNNRLGPMYRSGFLTALLAPFLGFFVFFDSGIILHNAEPTRYAMARSG